MTTEDGLARNSIGQSSEGIFDGLERAGAGIVAYRLRPDETVAKGLTRLAGKELRRARDELTNHTPPREEAIHEARKSLKKARSIWQLVKDDRGRGIKGSDAALHTVNGAVEGPRRGRHAQNRRGKRAMARALDRGRAVDYHEWRKAIKALWYELRLIEQAAPYLRRDVHALHQTKAREDLRM